MINMTYKWIPKLTYEIEGKKLVFLLQTKGLSKEKAASLVDNIFNPENKTKVSVYFKRVTVK